ncbi:Uncharacterized protein YyaP [Symbiodinium microadriaticum]|uniref:Uncharacterized protein YyaP n=1 Tax=Symbiodinium microadriaticum TaxID=2951 RepID=A0A1Q9D756_SYMMI|nr:Uncharacterized protein YyaP [Symbiodinium microadriaticum]
MDPDCQDDESFIDEKGYFCDTWVGDDCSKAQETWGYSAAGQQAALTRYRASTSKGDRWSVQALAAAGVKDVYVDGGETIRGFIAAGAVKRVILTKIPLTLGEGIPLFTEEQMSKLKEVSSKTLPGGMVQTTYIL